MSKASAAAVAVTKARWADPEERARRGAAISAAKRAASARRRAEREAQAAS